MRRFVALFVGLLSVVCTLQAQASGATVPIRYRLSANAGSMMRGSIADEWLGNLPVLGGEIAVEFLPTGKSEGLLWYNNASLGLALNYLNITNSEMLGHAIAPYVYLNIPLVRLPHFILGLRPGIGVSFVNKTYYNTVPEDQLLVGGSISYPIANGAIGSVTNAYFAEAIYMEFPIQKGISITASYGWYHISNGSTRQPNSGYNMFNGALGVSYFPGEADYSLPERPKGRYDGKRWDIEIGLSGGFRQAYYRDDRTFGIGTASISAHYRPCRIFKIGAGLDVFYDGYYRSISQATIGAEATISKRIPLTYFQKTYLTNSNIANCFRVGISLQPEFVVGKFTAGFHVGFYVVDPIKNLEPYNEIKDNNGKPLNRGIFYKYDLLNAGIEQDGWLYTRVLMKYRFTDNFFLQLGMKSHLSKVEFFDFGFGASF